MRFLLHHPPFLLVQLLLMLKANFFFALIVFLNEGVASERLLLSPYLHLFLQLQLFRLFLHFHHIERLSRVFCKNDNVRSEVNVQSKRT